MNIHFQSSVTCKKRLNSKAGRTPVLNGTVFGRAKTGAVADCMRQTRASYPIRQVEKEKDAIVRERITEALLIY